jgi:Fungal specific transcription factor domain
MNLAYRIRRLHGDLITTTITSGLHRLPDYGKVTAASEYRRRLFSAIYCNDKTHASLNGTPPLLTPIFCNIQPCLDLPNGAIFLTQDELALAVSKLDPDGWNTSGEAYHLATMMRIKVQLCMIREEILELALGVNVDGSEARIKSVPWRYP